MNKSDKYYLKQGKLELSMLDDDDELELSSSLEVNPKRDAFADLEFPHTKRIRENRSKQVRTKESKLKVTQDIYNTLHTMGQFLTKADEGETEEVKPAPPRKVMNAAKAQKLEQIASTLKIQELELPPRAVSKEDVIETTENKDDIPFESIPIDKQKEIITVGLSNEEAVTNEEQEGGNSLQAEIDAQINELLAEEKELENSHKKMIEALSKQVLEAENKPETTVVKEEDTEVVTANQIPETGVKQVTVVSAIEKEVHEVYYGTNSPEENKLLFEEKEIDPNKELQQSHIDEVLRTFFGNVTPQYTYARELKHHIDKQIAAIENYK